MASTAPKVPEVERRDAPEMIDQQAAALVKLIQKSKHFVVFTGAGVSTSAGIPDFRGPEGAWTLRAQGRQRTTKAVSTLQAIPTPTHMALLELQNQGILKYLVSQNCDGLHRRSGILPGMISELHGNSNREYCRDCGVEYLRDFRAVATYEKTVRDHRTGRKCSLCGGVLLDSIINFGESLPEDALQLAFDHANKADLCLVLGSSLTVSPANEVPETVGLRRGAKLVICNLQKTPLDRVSHLRIFSEADGLMTRVMKALDLEIPRFLLRRRLAIRHETKGDDQQQVTLLGLDVDDTPASFLRSVRLGSTRRVIRSEPFTFSLRDGLNSGDRLDFELEFMGHYNEPNLVIADEYLGQSGCRSVFNLQYDPSTGQWIVAKE